MNDIDNESIVAYSRLSAYYGKHHETLLFFLLKVNLTFCEHW